jgi:hypothetical protein
MLALFSLIVSFRAMGRGNLLSERFEIATSECLGGHAAGVVVQSSMVMPPTASPVPLLQRLSNDDATKEAARAGTGVVPRIVFF